MTKIVAASDLQNMTFPPVRHILPGYISEGATIIAGKPKVGKSWLTLDLCLAATANRFTLGTLKPAQGDVLYLALEDNKRRPQKATRKQHPELVLRRGWCRYRLNTSPAPSPVNASRLPSRTIRASLGASAVRYSFTVTDFHRLPLAGLPAHPSTHDPSRHVAPRSPTVAFGANWTLRDPLRPVGTGFIGFRVDHRYRHRALALPQMPAVYSGTNRNCSAAHKAALKDMPVFPRYLNLNCTGRNCWRCCEASGRPGRRHDAERARSIFSSCSSFGKEASFCQREDCVLETPRSSSFGGASTTGCSNASLELRRRRW